MEPISYLQALDRIRNVKPVFSKRVLPIDAACGWTLAEPLFAKYSVPSVPSSALNGYAVVSAETVKANERKHVTLTNFEHLSVGCPVPEPCDAVIPEDEIVSVSSSGLKIRASVKPGVNVRGIGEDILKGRLILPAGAKLRAFDVGALAGYGYVKVPVRTVSVGIVSTGKNLVKPGSAPKPGQKVESNSYMASAYVSQFGVAVTRYNPVEDDRGKIRKILEKAVAENDLILITPGMVRENFSQAVLELGVTVFDGVLMKPAHHTMLAEVSGKPVIALPGHPLAAATALRMFVRPLLEMWGFSGPTRTKLTATAGSVVVTEEDIDELRFGAAAFVEGKPVALPETRSSALQMSGIRSNGYLHIPRGMKTVESGNVIKAVTDADSDELKRTILIGGCYSQGMELFVENAAEAGLQVRFGEGDPVELLNGKYCHAICSDRKLTLNIPTESFALCDGTYLIMRTDMNDSLCGCLRRFAGVI